MDEETLWRLGIYFGPWIAVSFSPAQQDWLYLASSRRAQYTYRDQKHRRVGLIGCGWYGKCDLFRLIQVSPVEVVSMCDVDKQMLSQAAEMVAARQASKKTPRTFSDYRAMLREKDLDMSDDRAARSLARAADDRSREVRYGCVGAEAYQCGCGRRPSHGRRGAQSITASCRSSPSAAAPPT